MSCSSFLYIWVPWIDLAVISSTFVASREYLWQIRPQRNVIWIFSICICTILTVGFISIFTFKSFMMSQLPFWIHLLAFMPIFLLFPLLELVKSHDKQDWNQFQKRAHLEFNTKLGMHSPL